MRGYYSQYDVGEPGYLGFKVYKSDGSFGSCFTVPKEEGRANLAALGQMGYRPLPNGWTALDVLFAVREATDQ